jgi:hypothetical protein
MYGRGLARSYSLDKSLLFGHHSDWGQHQLLCIGNVLWLDHQVGSLHHKLQNELSEQSVGPSKP